MKIQLEQWEERNIQNFLNKHEHWFDGGDDKDKLNASAHFFKRIKDYLLLEGLIDKLSSFGYTASHKKSYAQEYLKQMGQIFGGNDINEGEDEVSFYYGRLMCSLYIGYDEIDNLYLIKLSPNFDMAWYGTDEWLSLNINEILCSY